MFNGINKVILIGYLGFNPEIVSFANKKSFVKINVATSSSWKDNQTQEWVKRVEWHQVILYNKFVTMAEKYLKKGSRVYIEGFLKTDKFEKNETTFFSTKIICNNILLLNSKDDKVPFEKIDFSYEDENVSNIEKEDLPF
ncbi:MAG TPA: single-stranded DNA-binding protein [Candidatus Azosocius sp. HAIN]